LTVALEAGLVCRDLPLMERFCAEVLGFEKTHVLHFENIGHIVKMRRDGARIKLFRPDAPVRQHEAGDGSWFTPGGWRYVAVYLAERIDVFRLADAVAGAGGRVLVAPADHRPGACAALVADPEGNAWELLWEQ
jgi:hypothetical protein